MAEPRKKIACIEDDREIASLIAEHLLEWGFEPIVAHSGDEGFVEIIKQHPDLVLCDIKVPYMSGFEVLERLNDIALRFGQIPFVLLAKDRENELRGRRLGGRLHHQANRFRRAPNDHQRPACARRAQRDMAEAHRPE
jgi:DNA-binding response OmpR family regulator